MKSGSLEPKPPGTFWVAPGLLRDSFIEYWQNQISSEEQVLVLTVQDLKHSYSGTLRH